MPVTVMAEQLPLSSILYSINVRWGVFSDTSFQDSISQFDGGVEHPQVRVLWTDTGTWACLAPRFNGATSARSM